MCPAHVLELLAVVHSLRVFVSRDYLLGSGPGAPRPPGTRSEFSLCTNNQAVTRLRTERKVNRFISRWLDEIEEFRFDVEYVPGRINPADLLSRRGLPAPVRPGNLAAAIDTQAPAPAEEPAHPDVGVVSPGAESSHCGHYRGWHRNGQPVNPPATLPSRRRVPHLLRLALSARARKI